MTQITELRCEYSSEPLLGLGAGVPRLSWRMESDRRGARQVACRVLAASAALLLQTAWPSWLYAVTQGATTIWERWDGWTAEKGFQTPSMNSFNHYAYSAVGE
jgi:hypothetical protein